MQITFDLPDEMVTQLQPFRDKIPQVLELGLRELNANPNEFSGLTEILEFLASLPTPEAVIALRPSKAFQDTISNLLDKNHTANEEQLWQNYQYLEHIVRMAKARAFLKLKDKA